MQHFFPVRGIAVLPPVAGGGYNNLTNWPSVANRPTLSGSTLSWIGPVGGGVSTANDVSQSLLLTNNGGDFTTTSNNQVVTGLIIVGLTSVHHTGVHFKNCVFKSGDTNRVVSCDGANCLIEDCIVDGVARTSQNGIGQTGFSGFTTDHLILRRCNLTGLENHLSNDFTNCLIIDCWFHGTFGPDADMIELNANCDSNTAQHNSFDGTDTDSGSFLNSGVNVTNSIGSITNTALINNAFINITAAFHGSSTHAINDDNGQGAGSVTMSATNNGFFNCGGYRRDGVTCSPNSGNFNMATATATSGTATNGDGTI